MCARRKPNWRPAARQWSQVWPNATDRRPSSPPCTGLTHAGAAKRAGVSVSRLKSPVQRAANNSRRCSCDCRVVDITSVAQWLFFTCASRFHAAPRRVSDAEHQAPRPTAIILRLPGVAPYLLHSFSSLPVRWRQHTPVCAVCSGDANTAAPRCAAEASRRDWAAAGFVTSQLLHRLLEGNYHGTRRWSTSEYRARRSG